MIRTTATSPTDTRELADKFHSFYQAGYARGVVEIVGAMSAHHALRAEACAPDSLEAIIHRANALSWRDALKVALTDEVQAMLTAPADLR
jgi:hypothetical protein